MVGAFTFRVGFSGLREMGSKDCSFPCENHRISRRKALGVVAVGLASFSSLHATLRETLKEQPLEPEKPGRARAPSPSYEILEVGPGKRFPSLTLAGCYMSSTERWNGGSDPQRTAKMGFHLIVSPGPPGYYINDSGSHSRRWPDLVGWPPYEGTLLGPVIIEGEPGKAAPVLETDGYADGVLYYQTGLFATGSCDATFKRLTFKGFRRRDDIGNYAAVRLGQTSPKIPMNSQVLFEDCEISGCDNGIMGGAPGQSLTLRRCYIHDNGNDTGRVHNLYFGAGDVLTIEDTLSTRCRIGHLAKTRAAKTIIRNSRLIGNGGTESACLDVPDGGILDIDGLICEKSPASDAIWIIHYAGENQDESGTLFHNPSYIKIQNLTMLAPATLTRHPGWGGVLGLANQSGSGEAASGKGSFLVTPNSQGVRSFGLTAQNAGLPCEQLKERPTLNLKSPAKK